MHNYFRAITRHFTLRNAYFYGTCSLWGGGGIIFLQDNVYQTSFIEGESMAPTLSATYKQTGRCDLMLWRKWSVTSDLKRGDVVQFLNPHRPEALAVKRIIGLPGDVVLLDRERRPSVREGPEPRSARAWDQWRGRALIPDGHLWVEGDNRTPRGSFDSNDYGPISKSLIEGRAVAVVKPLSKFWTQPWEGFKSRTKVIKPGGKVKDWTEGLPVEFAEIQNPSGPFG